MNFEWDENKNLSNIDKHAIDFNDVCLAFSNPFIVQRDVRKEYGEDRNIAIGSIHDICIIIVLH